MLHYYIVYTDMCLTLLLASPLAPVQIYEILGWNFIVWHTKQWETLVSVVTEIITVR